jgi:hypothetical protein
MIIIFTNIVENFWLQKQQKIAKNQNIVNLLKR